MNASNQSRVARGASRGPITGTDMADEPTVLGLLHASITKIEAGQQSMSESLTSLRADVAGLKGRAAVWGFLAGGGMSVMVAGILRAAGV